MKILFLQHRLSYSAKYFLVLFIKTAKRETACGRGASPQPHCAVTLLDCTRKHAFNKKQKNTSPHKGLYRNVFNQLMRQGAEIHLWLAEYSRQRVAF